MAPGVRIALRTKGRTADVYRSCTTGTAVGGAYKSKMQAVKKEKRRRAVLRRRPTSIGVLDGKRERSRRVQLARLHLRFPAGGGRFRRAPATPRVRPEPCITCETSVGQQKGRAALRAMRADAGDAIGKRWMPLCAPETSANKNGGRFFRRRRIDYTIKRRCGPTFSRAIAHRLGSHAVHLSVVCFFSHYEMFDCGFESASAALANVVNTRSTAISRVDSVISSIS